jgi:hypothetical protein
LAEWVTELVREFTPMTAGEARVAMHSLQFQGGDVGEHDATFRRLTALVEGLSPQEAVTAYVRSYAAAMPEVKNFIERARPHTWSEAARLAKEEVRRAKELSSAQQAGGPQRRDQLRAMDTTSPAQSQLNSLSAQLNEMRQTLNFLAATNPRPYNLSQQQYEERNRQGLCWRCGAGGHRALECPQRPMRGGQFSQQPAGGRGPQPTPSGQSQQAAQAQAQGAAPRLNTPN